MHDSDPFNRWQAAQTYATTLLTAAARGACRSAVRGKEAARLAQALCRHRARRPRCSGLSRRVPQAAERIRHRPRAWPRRRYRRRARRARDLAHATIGNEIRDDLGRALRGLEPPAGPYSPGSRERRQAGACAAPRSISSSRPARRRRVARAERHYREASNMTDAITALVHPVALADTPARDDGARRFLRALAGRAARARQMVRGAGARRAARIRSRPCAALLSHPKFSLKNPNRIRALIGSFVHANPTGFNRADGGGLSSSSPSRRSRSTASTRTWRRGCSAPSKAGASWSRRAQARAKAVLEDLAGQSLSTDSYEIVTKTLGAA